jgi:hypothetical protein
LGVVKIIQFFAYSKSNKNRTNEFLMKSNISRLLRRAQNCGVSKGGRASPLVAVGVNTPTAKWRRLLMAQPMRVVTRLLDYAEFPQGNRRRNKTPGGVRFDRGGEGGVIAETTFQEKNQRVIPTFLRN